MAIEARNFGISAVLIRFLFSLFVVFATYNPSGTSFVHWTMTGTAPVGAKLAVALVLLGVYIVILYVTWEVIGFAGMGLIALICLNVAWVSGQADLLDLADSNTVSLVLLTTLAAMITWGLSFAPLFKRLTGVLHTRGTIH
jgi:uncharacterized protein DUF6524